MPARNDIPEEWCLVWTGVLFKGTASRFDETSAVLHAPAFLASHEAEAGYYAATLKAEEGVERRVIGYEPVRPLRLLRLADRREEREVQLRTLGIPAGTPRNMAIAAGAAGWDGLALWGGESGWHVVLADPALVRHLETRCLENRDIDPSAGGTPSPRR